MQRKTVRLPPRCKGICNIMKNRNEASRVPLRENNDFTMSVTFDVHGCKSLYLGLTLSEAQFLENEVYYAPK